MQGGAPKKSRSFSLMIASTVSLSPPKTLCSPVATVGKATIFVVQEMSGGKITHFWRWDKLAAWEVPGMVFSHDHRGLVMVAHPTARKWVITPVISVD